MKQYFFFVLLCLTAIPFTRCSKYKSNPVGLDFLQRGNIGSEMHLVFQAAPSDTFFQVSAANGESPYLFFGQFGNIQAKTLVRFDTLTISGSVDSLVLVFKKDTLFSQTAGDLTLAVASLAKDWDQKTITWNAFDAGYVGTPIISKTFSATDTAIECTLPSEWALPLVHPSQSATQFGILLTVDSPDGLVQVNSVEGQSGTETSVGLRVYYNSTFSYVNSVKDAFIATSAQLPVSDKLVLLDGVAFRTWLDIPVSGIPPEATISRALLTLKKDPSAEFPSVQNNLMAVAVPVLDGAWTFPDVSIDSTRAVSAAAETDKLVFNMTSHVQGWTIGTSKNWGLLILGQYEKVDLSGLAFYSSQADSANRPTLDIYYTLPPSPPY